MTATIERGWSFNGVEIIRVTNDSVQVDLMPSLGGKIWGIRYLPSGKQVLWQNPRVRPHVAAVASGIDDHFSSDAVAAGTAQTVAPGAHWSTRVTLQVSHHKAGARPAPG